MTWLYKQTEPNLWTVGFYMPDGTFEPESDHESSEGAARRVHYLNGGNLLPEKVVGDPPVETAR